MMWLIWIPLVLFLLIVLVFLTSPVIGAYVSVKSRPREEMMWCDKGHGHFRKGYCLPMAGTLVCPQCYLKSLEDSGETKLWKK